MFDDNDAFYFGDGDGSSEDESAWAVSYGDLMSLLIAFFVMILSTMTVDKSKYEEVRRQLSGDVRSQDELKSLEMKLKDEIKKSGLFEAISIDRDSEGVQIVIKNDILFQPGSATLSRAGIKAFGELMEPLSSISEKYHFQIEGHTDDQPINNDKFHSNWELSTSRAVTVLNLFLDNNFNQNRFSVQGFADQKPIVSNRDSRGAPILKNMAKNRRVVIKIR